MILRLLAVAFIWGCTTVAWFALGGTLLHRSYEQDGTLRDGVSDLWGGPQVQHAPVFERLRTVTEPYTRTENGRTLTEMRTITAQDPQPLTTSALDVDLRLEQRQKGLLWYPTYRVRVDSRFRVVNETGEAGRFRFRYRLPENAPVLDNLVLTVNGKAMAQVPIQNGEVTVPLELQPGQAAVLALGYGSQGLETWQYRFGDGVAQVRDFALTMTTNFDAIDFPPGTLSPTDKAATDAGGWALTWRYGTLFAQGGVGLAMPQRLNPGPWASRVTFFAPVSLLLFFFVVFIGTLRRGVRLHPMHYFFLAAAFFAFHLLLAYLVDHLSVTVALLLCSAVSLGLVWSYMRLVTGERFALVEVGLAQLVYLVGFAYTFFLEGFTGLAITGLSIATLFLVMQSTGRLDWEQVFQKPAKPLPKASEAA